MGPWLGINTNTNTAQLTTCSYWPPCLFLTHWGLKQSGGHFVDHNVFSQKSVLFQFPNEALFFQFTISHSWFSWWLGAWRQEAITWTNDDPFYWCIYASSDLNVLTHWGRVTHICVGELTIIVADNGLSPGRRQVIIWTNAVILIKGPYGTNFS